jgi:hypothetical protein
VRAFGQSCSALPAPAGRLALPPYRCPPRHAARRASGLLVKDMAFARLYNHIHVQMGPQFTTIQIYESSNRIQRLAPATGGDPRLRACTYADGTGPHAGVQPAAVIDVTTPPAWPTGRRCETGRGKYRIRGGTRC